MTNLTDVKWEPTDLQRQCLIALVAGPAQPGALPNPKKSIWGPMLKFGWISQRGTALSITAAGKAALGEAPPPSPAKDGAPLSERVLSFFAQSGQTGKTDDEAAIALGVKSKVVAARRAAMLKRGQIKNSGQTRKSRSGKLTTVWVAV
jgi:hypothetical protein